MSATRLHPSPPARVALALIRSYRGIRGPRRLPTCKFHPTCSAYALRAVEAHGAWRGGVMAVGRLLRCHPWTLGGVDQVPEDRRRP